LEILLARMQWLAGRKQMNEARQVYAQATELVAASSLTTYQKHAFEDLDIKAFLKRDIKAEDATMPVVHADFQPLAVPSVSLPGLQAGGVFILSNPGVVAAKGTLSVTGPIVAADWEAEAVRWTLTQSGNSSRTVSLPAVTCLPGESVMVLLRHDPNEEEQSERTLSWTPNWKHIGNHACRWEVDGRNSGALRNHVQFRTLP
jgi:hypothetical protein